MSREVQIITWCDQCLAEGKHVEGGEYAGLNSAGTRVIVDLCDDHVDQFLTPAFTVFGAHGRTENKPIRAHRKVTAALGPCPECGKEFPSTQSLGMHRWRKHGVPSQNRNKDKSAA